MSHPHQPPYGQPQPPQYAYPPQAPQQYGYAAPPQQAASGAQYVRQQTGHSLTKHLLLGMFVLWINVIYISMSPNHYWHA